jgi:acetyl-CoA synthetase
MPKKKSISKVKKKTPKKTKAKKKIKPIRKKVLKKIEEKELIIKTKPEWVKSALVNKAKYQKKYSDSIKKNDDFWKIEGKRITWIKPYKKIKDVKYSKKEVKIKWYEDGTLNASANCIDRHLKDKKDKTAIIWVGDDPKDTKKISYKQLHNEVSKAANGLRKLGIKKGDRVTIYLTMIPELELVQFTLLFLVDFQQTLFLAELMTASHSTSSLQMKELEGVKLYL